MPNYKISMPSNRDFSPLLLKKRNHLKVQKSKLKLNNYKEILVSIQETIIYFLRIIN